MNYPTGTAPTPRTLRTPTRHAVGIACLVSHGTATCAAGTADTMSYTVCRVCRIEATDRGICDECRAAEQAARPRRKAKA